MPGQLRSARLRTRPNGRHPLAMEPASFHQIRLLGVNLNQIARRLNAQDMPAPPELAPLLADIQAALNKALAPHDPYIETGKSFRAAQLYYLHDKRHQDELLRVSDERVAWTASRNTANDNADGAFAEMIATARDQDYLKIMSGGRLTGRPCEQPVMTVSLSWHPSETPSKEQILQAADSYLRHMRWDDHQAVYVCHSDTPHAHVHIILNRIHPETGRVRRRLLQEPHTGMGPRLRARASWSPRIGHGVKVGST